MNMAWIQVAINVYKLQHIQYLNYNVQIVITFLAKMCNTNTFKEAWWQMT